MNLSKEDVKFLDTIITKVGAGQQTYGVVTALEIDQLAKLAIRSFALQETLVELDPPVTIMGDIHGQYRDLLGLFQFGGWPPKTRYLFLGDYVDRGSKSIEVITLLLALKVRFPNDVFLLRGNHESRCINRSYGFYMECVQRYSCHVWNAFQEAFNMMPLCALVGHHIMCMHGGLPKHLKNLDDIKRFQRPLEVPDEGIVCDLVWADPEKDIKGWESNNERGVSWMFGEDVVLEYCEKFDLDLIVRAHQVFDDGYMMFASGKLITIFSAPNYAGTYRNAAAMLSVNEQMVCAIKTVRTQKEKPADDDVASEEETMAGVLGDGSTSSGSSSSGSSSSSSSGQSADTCVIPPTDNGPLWMRRALNQLQQRFESNNYSLYHPGQPNPPKRWWRTTMKSGESHLSYRASDTAPIELTVLVKSDQAPVANQSIVITATSTITLKAQVEGVANAFEYVMNHRGEYDTKPPSLAALDTVLRAEIEERFLMPVLEAAKTVPQKPSLGLKTTINWFSNWLQTETGSNDDNPASHEHPPAADAKSATGKQPETKPIEPKPTVDVKPPSTPTETKPIEPKPAMMDAKPPSTPIK